MTKKDYKTLAIVFNRRANSLELTTPASDYSIGRDKMYYQLLERTIDAIRANDPKFDADRFMREIG